MYFKHLETSRAAKVQHNVTMMEAAAARRRKAEHHNVNTCKGAGRPRVKWAKKLETRMADWGRMAQDNKWGDAGFNESSHHKPGSWN